MTSADRTSYACGFADLDLEVSIERLPVKGTFPAWLTGTLLRTGPAKFDIGARTLNHWFDGFAMLHRFGFAGGAVSYANRFLQSQSFEEAVAAGALERGEFATDPCRTLFQRVSAVFSQKLTDNCNVNIDAFGGAPVALTETTLPVRFDADTLETLGHFPISPEVGGTVSIAHPHYDEVAACRYSYVVEFGRHSHYRLFSIADQGGAEQVVAEMPVDRPAYMHSFAMTERYLVLAEFPLVVDPLRLLLMVAPFIKNYRWTPDRGLRFHVFEKDGGRLVTSLVADPAFAFHHVNAYEEGDTVVLDMIAYPDAGIIDQLYLARLRAGDPVNATGTLTRYILPLDGSQEVAVTEISDAMIELPRIDYGLCAARPYRWVWGTGRRTGAAFLDSIVKIDVASGAAREWWAEHCFPGEPVFVPAPGRTLEGEGILLSVVLDARRGTSFLLVLDAQTLTEIARAECPHHIPFGFHGSYFTERGPDVASVPAKIATRRRSRR
jgi:carotenoid cleavage dioxygenase-like enzyme